MIIHIAQYWRRRIYRVEKALVSCIMDGSKGVVERKTFLGTTNKYDILESIRYWHYDC